MNNSPSIIYAPFRPASRLRRVLDIPSLRPSTVAGVIAAAAVPQMDAAGLAVQSFAIDVAQHLNGVGIYLTEGFAEAAREAYLQSLVDSLREGNGPSRSIFRALDLRNRSMYTAEDILRRRLGTVDDIKEELGIIDLCNEVLGRGCFTIANTLQMVGSRNCLVGSKTSTLSGDLVESLISQADVRGAIEIQTWASTEHCTLSIAQCIVHTESLSVYMQLDYRLSAVDSSEESMERWKKWIAAYQAGEELGALNAIHAARVSGVSVRPYVHVIDRVEGMYFDAPLEHYADSEMLTRILTRIFMPPERIPLASLRASHSSPYPFVTPQVTAYYPPKPDRSAHEPADLNSDPEDPFIYPNFGGWAIMKMSECSSLMSRMSINSPHRSGLIPILVDAVNIAYVAKSSGSDTIHLDTTEND